MVNNMEISRTNVYVADILLSLLATVAVIARFWVRKLRKARYGADDWTILASLVRRIARLHRPSTGLTLDTDAYVGLVGHHHSR